MSSQLRISRTLLALALGIGLLSGTALAQTKLPTGEEDAAAPAAAARTLARSAPTEEQQAAAKLQQMTKESTEGLKVETRANGMRAMNLEGTFMSVAVATPAKNGGYVLSCQSGESVVEHAKHAHDVEVGKAPKTLLRPTAKQQPALEEK